MDQVAQIREKIDIVSFISDYLTLKKAGKNFQALCPFHGEKTPSFVISPERQIWHCFGCGKGGDIYTFLMEYERLEFPEALRILAKQAGIELIKSGIKDTSISEKKERLMKANLKALDFYHYVLTKHDAGQKALEYLINRGLNEKLIETFKLGFAPNSTRSLTRYLLQKKRIDKNDLIESGLGINSPSGISDFFRNRLIFPLIDYRENVLGFSGRLLDEEKGFGGKYINTKETLIYQKRTQFFGINITLPSIRKANQVILVEGEFDVISCFKEGMTNVVGIKGTSLTEEQVNLLSRFVNKVILSFDSDNAGVNAIIRGLPLLSKKGLSVSIVNTLNKDPDEAIRTNVIEFKKQLSADVNVYDFLFDKSIKENAIKSPEGKRKIADFLLPIIDSIDNAIIKEHYLRKLSSIIDTTYESIITELDKKKTKTIEKTLNRDTLLKRSRQDILEEYLLALIFQSGEYLKIAPSVWKILSEFIPKNNAYQKLLTYFIDFIGQVSDADLIKFSSSLPTELIDIYNTTLLLPLPSFSDSNKLLIEAEKTATNLKTKYLKDKIKHITGEIGENENLGKNDAVEKLKEEYARLVGLLKN